MEFVYVLYHVYEYGENDEFDECKKLGIYSTQEKAQEAIERYAVLEGFNKYPRSCFEIFKHKVDVDLEWTDGFMSWEEIEKYQEENNVCRTDEYKKSIYEK